MEDSQSNNHLCRCCRSFFELRIKPGNRFSRWRMTHPEPVHETDWYEHWPTFADFVQAATHGCHLCALFLLQVSPKERSMFGLYEKNAMQRNEIGLSDAHDRAAGRYDLSLYNPLLERLRMKDHAVASCMTLQLQPTQALHCDLGTYSQSYNPLNSYSVAVTWIMNCLVNHDSCSHPRPDDRRRPARIIAVGSLPDFSDVKLCCLSDLERDFLYVTLSHCWGPSGLEMKLTAPVEKSLKERIPWDSLPKTFRDAILITRTLQNAFGVKYIWIDALCILQDSPGDWDQEASNMADIYRYSFCNLAACVGVDSHSGLFWGRDPCWEHSCGVEATIEDSTASFYKVENRMIFNTSVKASILETRAWVLQEVLLAPRVLYFTPQQWVWECATLCASEMAPNETLIGSSNKQKSFDAPFVFVQSKSVHHEQSHPFGADYRLYRVWIGMVNLYTSRKLTKARDKLVAIAGLAKQMHARLHVKDEYIAGLWGRNLILHMLWRISYGQRATRPQPYRAPTWSWASVDGTVYNHRTNLGAEERCTAIVEFTSPKMVYVTDDIFGEVESAEICMKGSLFKVDFELNVRTADQLVSMALLQWQGKTFTKFGQDSTNLDFETSVNTKPESIFCLPIVSEIYGQKHYLICLLLEPITGKKGIYQRYGICDLVKAFDIIQEAKMFPLDEDLYVQAHGEGIYTIVII